MRYAILIYGVEPDGPYPEDLYNEMMDQHMAFGQKWGAQIFGGEELAPSMSATTVRYKGDEQVITDGPFAETKEHLGGFYLIEAADLDEAIKIAAEIPGGEEATREIRPIVDHSG